MTRALPRPAGRNTRPAEFAGLRMTSYPMDIGEELPLLAGPRDILWNRQGEGFVGIGAAGRWQIADDKLHGARLAEVAKDLRALTARSASGQPRPRVFGAIPFLPGTEMVLVLPEVTVRQGPQGECIVTVIHSGDAPAADTLRDLLTCRNAGLAYPEAYHIRSAGLSHARWKAQVAEATSAIAEQTMQKVVLARRVRISASGPIPRAWVLRRLIRNYPSCMVFGFGDFVAASPELLLSRTGRSVKSFPLAGTVEYQPLIGAGNHLEWDQALSADKNMREHKWVVRAIEDDLARCCASLSSESTPRSVRVGGLVHLGTLVQGTLRCPVPTSAELCRLLVPTPAVAGYPRQAALDFLAGAEEFDRGLYGGAVGWMDSSGDGEWALGIRCGRIFGHEASLFAGVGVVDGSDPEAELLETQWKLKPMIDAIVMP